MNYKHTQTGYLMIFVLIAVFIIFGFALFQTDFNLILVLFFIMVLFILYSFSSLSVFVDDQFLRIKFGYGLYKKSFSLEEIVLAKAVKNPWYYGWGIRFQFWRGMWTYNVSGFDPVEIKMKNGRIYRIGTDDVKNLEQAVLQSKKA